MLKIKRTESNNVDFIELAGQLDAFYRRMFGAAMDYFEQFNKIDKIKHAVVIYEDDVPVACCSFRPFDEFTAEIKRMYVLPAARKKGIATEVLSELEQWAKETGYTYCNLETSISLTDAINLYRNNGYKKIENWGQYANVETSICMRKTLLQLPIK